jgi:hypothetical protein
MSSQAITIGDSVVGTRKFGGVVYAVSFEFGGTESPSSLTLSIVRDKGAFSTPTLNSKGPVSESILIGGGTSFKGYLVSWNKDIKPEQETMQVKYVDGSYSLDKYLIGLKTKHGKGGGNMIILGKEYHPCDNTRDSLTPFNFNPSQKDIDWCDPCPFCPVDKYEKSCSEPVATYIDSTGVRIDSSKILDVKYTYNEFFERISAVISGGGFQIPDHLDRPVDHTGTIRDVLSSFCSEYGYTWYWDFFSDSLKFLDLKSPQSVDQNIASGLENLAEYSVSSSIEETFSTTAVIRYEKEGGEEDYTCSDDRIVSLIPMTFDNLVNTSKVAAKVSVQGGNEYRDNPLTLGDTEDSYGIRLDILAALAYYSQALWECGVYYNGYGILNDEKAKEMKNKRLSFLGGMKILEVYGLDEENAYNDWNSAISEEERIEINEANRIAAQQGTDDYYYFMVVEVSLDGIAKEYERMKQIAENFLGQYWFRRYSPTFCGGKAKSSDVSIEAPDGSPNFYSYGDLFDGQALAQIGFDEGSIVSDLIREAGPDSENEQSVSFEERNYKSSAAFILMQREAKWYPNSTTLEYYQHDLDWFEEQAPKFVGGADGRPDILLRNYPGAKENKNIRLLLIKARPEKFKVTVNEKENWLEKEDGKKIYLSQAKDREEKPYEEKPIGKIGLMDNRSSWINFHQFGFLAPVGSFYNEGASPPLFYDRFPLGISLDTVNTDSPKTRYRVRVSQNYNVSRAMPKIQYNKATTNSGGLRAEMLEYQIDDDEVKVEGLCAPSIAKADEQFERLKEYAVNGLEPSTKVEFKLAGAFPENYEIEDGLDSFSINVDENGVFTSYSLSSRYRKPPSTELLKLKNNNGSFKYNNSFIRKNAAKSNINTSKPGENRDLPVV